ncbi:Pre-mRNA-splicing factor SPF27 [Lipomyces kononenkoae]|uniref:Pre-mRNA-splicing factor SPF27 n=1 Tax=Lipomyces kononenkoae TaxID=34357 RepID=A0ACC3TBM5_LIPKO
MTARDQWSDMLHVLHTAPEPVPEIRKQVEDQIRRDLALHPPPKTGVHPSIPALPEFKFTPMIQDALTRISEANGDVSAIRGIDLSRYTSLDFEAEDPASQEENLRKAYVALGYTQIRKDNLDLMSLVGRNQWLLGNDELEQDLKTLEQDVMRKQNEAALVARREKGTSG